jgi:hypothetical protein
MTLPVCTPCFDDPYLAQNSATTSNIQHTQSIQWLGTSPLMIHRLILCAQHPSNEKLDAEWIHAMQLREWTARIPPFLREAGEFCDFLGIC